MARLAEAAPILEAAEQWKNDCLLGGGSVFSDKSLWTRPNFEALNRFYVNNLDEGEGDFFGKLKKQLEPAPAGAKQLAAELFWVMYLMVHESGARSETKRFQIKKVWEWSGEPLPQDHPAPRRPPRGGSLPSLCPVPRDAPFAGDVDCRPDYVRRLYSTHTLEAQRANQVFTQADLT